MIERTSLDDLLLAAFRRALAAERPDVAEHVLQALEALARGDDRAGGEGNWLPQLAEAYRLIGRDRGR